MDFSQPLPFIIESFEKDISNEEYHSHGSEIISSSFVKGVCKGGSVGHALKPFEGNTKALEFGTAFHDYMEHNGALPEDKYVKCDLDQRTKAYKELKANNQDSIFLKSEDFDALHQMYENTQANEAYQSLYQDKTVTVPLAPLFKIPASSSLEAWNLLFSTRQEAQKILESYKDKGIENALDAELILPLSLKQFQSEYLDLTDIFGVSRIQFHDSESIEIRDLRNEPRCERSWKRDETVSLRDNDMYLSDRDYKVLTQLS